MTTLKIESIHENSPYFYILEGVMQEGGEIAPSQYLCISQNAMHWNIRINNVFRMENRIQIEISKSDLERISPELLIGNHYPIKGGINLALTSFGFGVSWWMPFILIAILGVLVYGMVILKT